MQQTRPEQTTLPQVDLALVKPPSGSPPAMASNYASQSMIGETLGLASISANVKASGFTVFYLDAHFENMTIEQAVAAVADRRPSVVGILLRFPFVSTVKSLTDLLRYRLPGAVIVVGGQYASINSKTVLEWLPSVDAVCVGNGEYPVLHLLTGQIQRGQSSPTVVWRDELRIDAAAAEFQSVTLDLLPWPDRKYLGLSKIYGYNAVGMSSSRGCPFRCSFCVPHAYSRNSLPSPWQFRSATSVVDEIEYHVEQGDGLFTFSDEHFIPHKTAKNRSIEIAQLIKRRRIDTRYMFDCRADAVELELFKELASSGLYRVYIGFEAADDDMLMDYRNDQRHGIYERAIIILSKLGI